MTNALSILMPMLIITTMLLLATVIRLLPATLPAGKAEVFLDKFKVLSLCACDNIFTNLMDWWSVVLMSANCGSGWNQKLVIYLFIDGLGTNQFNQRNLKVFFVVFLFICQINVTNWFPSMGKYFKFLYWRVLIVWAKDIW